MLALPGNIARALAAAKAAGCDAYDNGLVESIIGLCKTEAITTDVFHSGPLKPLVEVEYTSAGWVDWKNRRRPHSKHRPHPTGRHEQDYRLNEKDTGSNLVAVRAMG